MAGPFATQGKLSENWPLRGLTRVKMKSKLQVMKFGGTSVGDASCIARAAQIVAQAAKQNAVVAVMSAMSRVTNRLAEGAYRAGAARTQGCAALTDPVRHQQQSAAAGLRASANGPT